MERVVVDRYDGQRASEQVDALEAVWTPEGWVFRKGVRRLFNLDGVSIAEVIPFDEYKSGYQERPADLAIYIGDNRRVTEDYGWKPRRSAETILRDLFDWVREHEATCAAGKLCCA